MYTVYTYINNYEHNFTGIKPSMNVGRFFPWDAFCACLTTPIPTRKGLPSPLVRKLALLSSSFLSFFLLFPQANHRHNDPESVKKLIPGEISTNPTNPNESHPSRWRSRLHHPASRFPALGAILFVSTSWPPVS